MRSLALLTTTMILLAATSAPAQVNSLALQMQAETGEVVGSHEGLGMVEVPSLIGSRKPKPRTFSINHLITIIIRETASHATSGSVTAERDSSIDGSLDAWVKLKTGNWELRPERFADGKPEVAAQLKREFDGSGKASRTDTITARITGRIIDIKPNGNLVIEASKRIETDEESYVVTVTGTCRTEDVNADNSVLSTELADLEVIKRSQGNVKDATKRGLLHKVLDATNLF